jgi:hypothetical protein
VKRSVTLLTKSAREKMEEVIRTHRVLGEDCLIIVETKVDQALIGLGDSQGGQDFMRVNDRGRGWHKLGI